MRVENYKLEQSIQKKLKMGQCKSTRRAVDFSDDESEWEVPQTQTDLADDVDSELAKIDEHMRAQRDVLALLESQLSVLARDEELISMLGDDDDQHKRKLRRKRRRHLTYYRSSELITC